MFKWENSAKALEKLTAVALQTWEDLKDLFQTIFNCTIVEKEKNIFAKGKSKTT